MSLSTHFSSEQTLNSSVPCPYKGLMPYEDGDEQYFFGREREIQIVISNLYAARLTTFYGASGVGKSSVLGAGVVAQLRSRIQAAKNQGEVPDVAVVYFKQWQRDMREDHGEDGLSRLKTAIVEEMKAVRGEEGQSEWSAEGSLREVIRQTTEGFDGDLMVILDQFEEYFLYHPDDTRPGSFAREFVEAVNDTQLPVSFLLSIRGDSLSTLDRFKGKIPNLFSNSLRLKPLSAQAARVAMIKPLEKHAQRYKAEAGPTDIEERLIDQIVADVPSGRVLIGERGQAEQQEAAGQADTGIETPYLQLVLTRLWHEEKSKGSPSLTLDTYEGLEKAEGIVKTHLDQMMDRLSEEDRDISAQLFLYLITPSGTKIAMTLADLEAYTKLPEEKIESVLRALSSQQDRILAPVTDGRYELFHDALATAVLDWRGRYFHEQETREAEARAAIEQAKRKKKLLTIYGVLGVVLVVSAITLFLWMQAKQSKLKAAMQEAELIKQQDRAHDFYAKGSRFLLKGKTEQAMSSFEKALTLYEEFQNEEKIVEALLGLGRAYILEGVTEKGHDELTRALDIAKKQDNPQLLGMVLEQQAAFEEQQNNLRAAMDLYTQAESAYARSSDLMSRGRMLERLAAYYYRVNKGRTNEGQDGRDSNVHELLETALSSYRAAGHYVGVSRINTFIDNIFPWGYLLNIRTAQVYKLTGDEITIGRNAEGIENDISFSDANKFISRHHLSLKRNRTIEDLRSLNGTTINGKFLRYGEPRALADGDIITLANSRVLQFSLAPPPMPNIPKTRWAIFIDNQSKTYQYLHEAEYAVRLVNKKLVLYPGHVDDALLKIRWTGQLKVFEVPDEWVLRYFYKKGDYEYQEGVISKENVGQWLGGGGAPFQYQKQNADHTKVVEEGPYFQIVPFEG